MFLPPKLVAATNRYVENGPEDRAPSFKKEFPGAVTIAGATLRYSTTGKAQNPAEAKRAATIAALKAIAKAGS